jgi:predicted nucleotidyltransferase
VLRIEDVVPVILADYPDAIAIYLFGSHARGDARDDSDVDLAVLPARPIPHVRRWETQEKLAARLGRDVDLVDLLSASAVMRVQVLVRSRVLLDANPFARKHFEATALSDYARLQEERRGILEDVKRRGHVHG